jgi:hypothetical protein
LVRFFADAKPSLLPIGVALISLRFHTSVAPEIRQQLLDRLLSEPRWHGASLLHVFGHSSSSGRCISASSVIIFLLSGGYRGRTIRAPEIHLFPEGHECVRTPLLPLDMAIPEVLPCFDSLNIYIFMSLEALKCVPRRELQLVIFRAGLILQLPIGMNADPLTHHIIGSSRTTEK